MCKRKKQIEQATQLGEENPCYRSMHSLQWEDLFEGKTRQKLADDLAMFIIASDKLETHAISRFFHSLSMMYGGIKLLIIDVICLRVSCEELTNALINTIKIGFSRINRAPICIYCNRKIENHYDIRSTGYKTNRRK